MGEEAEKACINVSKVLQEALMLRLATRPKILPVRIVSFVPQQLIMIIRKLLPPEQRGFLFLNVPRLGAF